MTRNPLVLSWIALTLIVGLLVRASWQPNVSIQARPEGRASAAAHGVLTALPGPAKSMTAYMITVGGQDAVAVQSAQVAGQVVEQLKTWYRTTALQGAQKIEVLDFQEQIAGYAASVPEDRVRSLDDAVTILRLGTDKLIYHTVQSGDTLWDIAKQYGIDVDRLAAANSSLNPNALQLGDKVAVTAKEPFVHFMGVEVAEQNEETPFDEIVQSDSTLWPWQGKVLKAGVVGQRHVTYRITLQGNHEVKREQLASQVLSQPITQVRAQGTRQAPNLASGKYYWPVLGPITSWFGPRWGGFHPGVDIGVPEGTPIRAADTGTVTLAGWYGNYGRAIRIDHGGGHIVTLYGHLSACGVQVGDVVHRGDVIGYAGSTGFSTGPHLHFEIRVDGIAENPLDFYPDRK